MLRIRFIPVLILVFLFLQLLMPSCTIEKRHYQRGFHVTWPSGKLHVKEENKTAEKTIGRSLHDNAGTQHIEFPVDSLTALPNPIHEEGKTPFSRALDAPVQFHSSAPKDMIVSEDAPLENRTTPEKTHAQIHPSAAGSLLFGILSALCFLGLFATSFNPLGLVIALSIGIFTFAILAKRLSKRAFEDMHHARNRYSGRALAAAGLTLGIITIVAFIGLIAVMLFGIAFTNLV